MEILKLEIYLANSGYEMPIFGYLGTSSGELRLDKWLLGTEVLHIGCLRDTPTEDRKTLSLGANLGPTSVVHTTYTTVPDDIL